jgi:hypothetical protein
MTTPAEALVESIRDALVLPPRAQRTGTSDEEPGQIPGYSAGFRTQPDERTQCAGLDPPAYTEA